MKEIKGYNKWFEAPVDEGGDPFYWENGYTYVRMRVCMRVCASERIVMILPKVSYQQPPARGMSGYNIVAVPASPSPKLATETSEVKFHSK